MIEPINDTTKRGGPLEEWVGKQVKFLTVNYLEHLKRIQEPTSFLMFAKAMWQEGKLLDYGGGWVSIEEDDNIAFYPISRIHKIVIKK